MHLRVILLIFSFGFMIISARPLFAQGLRTSTDAGRPKGDLKATIMQARDELKARIEELRKVASETAVQKRAALQQQLQTIRDAKKRALVTNINDKMAGINTRRTQQMLNALDSLNSLLDRLVQKAEGAKAQGKDVTAVEQAITDARASIDTAQTAVASQSAKVYTFDATSSATLKPNVGQAVSQMESDLRFVHSLVVDAKQKVAAVIRELAKLGVGKIGRRDKVATASPVLLKPVIGQ